MARQKGREALESGSRIVHPELGAGVVRRSRRDGRAVLVSFDASPRLLLEVKVLEVKPETGPSARPGASAESPARAGSARHRSAKPPARPRTLASQPETGPRGPFKRPGATSHAELESPESLQAGKTLEALRLGVVPHADLRPSSVGRDGELALVHLDLDETAAAGSARVFLGDYGSGKTHMLELIEREALGSGFLVGRATLDAQYVAPNHPMRIYRSLVTSLCYPDLDAAAVGLEPLLKKATADPGLATELRQGIAPLARHLYLSPALHYFAALAELEDPVPRDLLLDWLSGQRGEGNQELDSALRQLARRSRRFRRGPTIYSLKDFQPWAHVYAYLLGGLSILARRCGYRGLVVMLDEAENYDLLGSAARSFADSVFRCLALAALGLQGVRFDSSTVAKGGFPPQKRLPFIFQWPQHLYFVSAMTPSTKGEELLRRLVPGRRLTELSPLSLADYHELSRRVTTIFEAAYREMRLPEQLNRPLGNVLWTLMRMDHIQNPRDATKLTVEFLDLLRLRPEALAAFFDDVERTLDA
jgi:hypothetical protein